MRYLILCSLFFSAALLSCSDKEKGVAEPESSAYWEYMPLEAGNYWKLGGLPKWDVQGSRIINGKEYYEVTDIHGTGYMRVKKNKVFYVPGGVKEDKAFEEAVLFDGNARVNDKWNFFEWEVTLKSNSETLVIGNSTINNCRKYYFDIPGMADDEFHIWLAPGIGYIQYRCLGECYGIDRKLEEAKIGGRVPAFLMNHLDAGK